MLKNILTFAVIFNLSLACQAQVISNDATNSSAAQSAQQLAIQQLKEQEQATTAVLVNGKRAEKDLREEVQHPNNILVEILQAPEILNSHGLGTNVTTLVFIERKNAGNEDSLQQRGRYNRLAANANILFGKKDFTAAAASFATAIKLNNDMGVVNDRYALACAYAATNKPNEAFAQLFRIAQKGNFYNYPKLENESLLQTLHTDARWSELLQIVKANAEKSKPPSPY